MEVPSATKVAPSPTTALDEGDGPIPFGLVLRFLCRFANAFDAYVDALGGYVALPSLI